MSRKSFTAILVSVAGLAMGVASAHAADLCLDLKFKCDGFEPNWQLFTDVVADGGDTVVRFTDPENPNWQTEPLIVDSCLLQGSPNDFELTTDAPLSLIANIVGQSCTQPNDDVTDFSVTVTFVQGALSGNPNQVQGAGCCQMLK
jgi:hypothetical protein